jgi:electron transport complex protein RnfG
MATDQPSRIRSLLLVIGVSIGAAALITGTYEFSFERILANERARLIENLSSVINRRPDAPPDALEIDPDALPEDDYVRQVFAMLDSAGLNAWVYSAVAPSGYNGPIEFLAGVTPVGEIVRIRVIQHRETPGLGDAIEDEKSDWARQFDDTSLGNPAMWALESAGGTFDGLTGATVTPRAVIAAIEGVLQYHAVHAASLSNALEAQRQTEAMQGE